MAPSITAGAWIETATGAGQSGAGGRTRTASRVSLKSLAVGGVLDGSEIDLLGSAGTVSGGAWDGGSLQADWLKTLSVKGNTKIGLAADMTGVDLQLTGWDSKGVSLSKMDVKGGLDDAQ